jgi:hypothetical protein
MRAHSLYSQNLDMTVKFFDKFDKGEIKKSIIEHLTQYPNDVLEHCKEYSKNNIKKYYGMEVINFYQNHNNNPCLVILRGDKKYYRKLD